jgi:hypothetical protein
VAPYSPARTKRLSLALRNPHLAGVHRLAAGPDAFIRDRHEPAVYEPSDDLGSGRSSPGGGVL